MKFSKVSQIFSSGLGVARTPIGLRLVHTSPPVFKSERPPLPPYSTRLVTAECNAESFAWLTRFNEFKKIPKDLVELSFSRSSGPGGQNVNKVNTKATIRCSVHDSWVPTWAIPALRKDPHFVESTQSLLVTSTVHRSQSQNVEDCLQKLHSIISSAASSVLVKPPSEEQTKKVEGLIKAEKARRRAEKMKRSSVKQGRSAKGGSHDFLP